MAEFFGGWGELCAALALFLVSHAVPARPRVRAGLIQLVGRPAYFIGYSIVSIAILAWLVAATASAPFVELWPREAWQAMVPVAGMLIATMLVTFGLSAPNPLSLSARRPAAFDPDRPGVVGLVRHPVLWALLLWSLAHMVPNGDLAHVIMFGLFALLSAGGMIILDRRKQRLLGHETWQNLARVTSNWPFLSLRSGWRPRPGLGAALRLAGGVLLYVALVATHGLFTGVPLL